MSFTNWRRHRLYDPGKKRFYSYVLYMILMLKSSGASNVYDELCPTDGNGFCNRQITDQKLSPSDCIVIFYQRNSTECSSQRFDHVQANKGQLGTIMIKPYLFIYDTTWKGTALNVTMSDIRWRYLRMRFMQIGNKKKNLCRDIRLSRNVNMTGIHNLFYDCLWSLNDYEGTDFDFEYELTNYSEKETGHYKFQVTNHDCITDSWTPYVFVNVANNNELILNWFAKPSTKKYTVNVIQDGNEILTTHVEGLTYTFRAGFTSGIYQFKVQPTDSYELCNIAYSPKIKIESSFIIIITGTLIAAMIFLCTLLFVCSIRKRKQMFKIEKSPTVLLIYSKSSASHVKVINSLATYLKKWCHINVLIDEIHIPQYHNSNPLLWYTDMMTSADWILITSSPTLYKTSTTSDIGIYQHSDCLALRLLGPRLIREGKAVTLLLPYCAKSSDIPSEARALTKYFFPNDMKKLLWHLHFTNRGCWLDYLLWKNIFPNIKHSLSHEAIELINAISVAEANIQNMSKDHFSAENKNCNNVQSSDKAEVYKELGQIIQLSDIDELEMLLPKRTGLKCIERHDKVDSDFDICSTFPGNIHEMDLLGFQNNNEKSIIQNNNTGIKFNINQLSL